MGRPIPYDDRRLIISRRQNGRSYKSIQSELGYSINGIKKIWYNYQKHGEASLLTSYKNCGRSSLYSLSVHLAISILKTGEQGAPFIYSMLKIKYPNLTRPSIRTIQRWWQEQGISRPKGRPSEQEKKIGLTKLMIHGKLMEKSPLL